MPGETVATPNPPPGPSHLPDALAKLEVKLSLDNVLSEEDKKSLELFRRAANYIAVCPSPALPRYAN